MTNREIKKLIKTSYKFEVSSSEKQFINSHEERGMQLLYVIKIELGFMGLKSAALAILLLIALVSILLSRSSRAMWLASSILPLYAMLTASLLGGSERYEMQEIEASCRFSLSFVRMIRMLISGVISLALILIFTILVKQSSEFNLITVLYFVSLPYLLNVFAAIAITRRVHGKEDLLLCAITTGLSCILPNLSEKLNIAAHISSKEFGVAFCVLIAVILIESYLYIQEGDKIVWNLS